MGFDPVDDTPDWLNPEASDFDLTPRKGRKMRDWSEPLSQCYIEAQQSNDPSTQNGAVVLERSMNHIVARGYNGFAKGLQETPERWERPLKYEYVVHAECAALLHAGSYTHGGTLVCAIPACANCAKHIIEAGIYVVVGHKQLSDFFDEVNPDWGPSRDMGIGMLEEAGLQVVWFDGPVEGPTIRVNGQTFDPAVASVNVG